MPLIPTPGLPVVAITVLAFVTIATSSRSIAGAGSSPTRFAFQPCPREPGRAPLERPDSDGDGIPDVVDRAPFRPRRPPETGCADLAVDEALEGVEQCAYMFCVPPGLEDPPCVQRDAPAKRLDRHPG